MMTPGAVTYAARLVHERNHLAGVTGLRLDRDSNTFITPCNAEERFDTLVAAIRELGAFTAANKALQAVVDTVKADRIAALDAELRLLGVVSI